jgi:hypothetical protein
VINIGSQNAVEYRRIFDTTIAQRSYLFSGLSGTGTLATQETVFNTFIDEPPPGFYTYRLEFLFRVTNSTGNMQVTRDAIDVRTLSTQVVKS